MYLKQKSDIMFRNYKSFGYITDNRNFGYKQTNNNEGYIGDKILSESGTVFMSVLNNRPQTLDELAKKIQQQFTDVNIETIKNDAIEFYNMLEHDGFVVIGETLQECNKKDIRFSYKNVESQIIHHEISSAPFSPEKSTEVFFEEYFGGKPQLTNVHIEITSKCNERCVHCYIPHEEKINYMGVDLFDSVISQCNDMKVLNVTLSGGEPMLHKNFCDFLRKCKEYNLSINVLTNLTLLTDEIIQEMKMNALLSVQVSLYSMDATIHDAITQLEGSFEKTKQAILELIENDIPLQISCPIMKQNKDCYTSVIQWAKKHKVHVGDDYGIIAEYNHTGQNLSCRLSIDEIKEVIYDKVGNDIKYLEGIEAEAEKKKDSDADDFVCTVCRSTICVTDTGSVYPCEGWQDYSVGDVKETSLYDIWNNSEKVQYLRNIRNKDFPQCMQCSDKEFCTMCMVRNANENSKGDPLVVNDFFCKIVKLNKEIVLEQKKKCMNC